MTITSERIQHLRRQGPASLYHSEFLQLLTLAERTIATRANAVQRVQRHRSKGKLTKPAEPAKRPSAGKRGPSSAITDPDLLRHLQL